MKIICLLPRILSLCFVLFLSLFSLDVFSEYSGWDVIIPLIIHLLPSFVLLLAVLIAWKYDLVGAIAFICFSIAYIWLVGLDRPLSWYASISLPSLIVGLCFLLCWVKKRKNNL
ncbi:MAG: hypothetical protein M0Q94_16040 [Candidatus Cloacimonetes bacterium]|nr:hypothetical protein [Candidatus Cloacimonadota bacterium]